MDINENKKKIVARFICLILSIGLWFYVINVENPLRVAELTKVPVQLLNADKLTESKLALSPNQNLYVNLKLEGTSQDLFGIDRNDFKVTVDLDEYALKTGELKVLVNIVEAPSNVAIKNKNGLDVKIQLEELATKEVPVESELQLISEDNYYISTPVIKPETVGVSGAQSLVDKVERLVVRGEEYNVTENLNKEYKIVPVDSLGNTVDGVQLLRNWVEVSFEVAEGKSVPITVKHNGNLKEGLKIKSLIAKPDAVGITGPQHLIDSIGEISTNQLDLSGVEGDVTLSTTLAIPEGLYVYGIENKIDIEVLVEKVTSREFTIPYTLIGQSDDVKITQSDKDVIVKVIGFEDQLNSISTDNLVAELDVSKYTSNGEYTEKPSIKFVNIDGIKIESISEVKFKVEKEPSTTTGTNANVEGEGQSTEN